MVFNHIKLFTVSTKLITCVALAFISTLLMADEAKYVVRVIDGDTVVLETGERVRLLGINAPELGYKGKPSDAGVQTAKDYLASKVLNQRIIIDVGMERKDKYTRTLAHLFLENGSHVNRQMLRSGMAFLSLHPPNLKYQKTLVLAQRDAEKQRLGLWSLKAYQLRPVAFIETSKSKKWGRYRGTISEVDLSSKGARLWLTEQVYIWVSSKHKRHFMHLKSYQGQHIEVRGWPRKWGRYWSIQAIHPSQILLR